MTWTQLQEAREELSRVRQRAILAESSAEGARAVQKALQERCDGLRAELAEFSVQFKEMREERELLRSALEGDAVPLEAERDLLLQEVFELTDELRQVREHGYLVRSSLPSERAGRVAHYQVGKLEVTIRPGYFEDGELGELFIDVAAPDETETDEAVGELVGGLLDAWATLFSIARRYRVPLRSLTAKGRGQLFGPAGFTSHPEIRKARSVLDFVCRWLDLNHDEAGRPVERASMHVLVEVDLAVEEFGQCALNELVRRGVKVTVLYPVGAGVRDRLVPLAADVVTDTPWCEDGDVLISRDPLTIALWKYRNAVVAGKRVHTVTLDGEETRVLTEEVLDFRACDAEDPENAWDTILAYLEALPCSRSAG